MNQITEQKELFHGRRRLKRLLAKEMFQLADWLRNNMDELKKLKATRTYAASLASHVLGFEVRTSGIEAAENMLGMKLVSIDKKSPRLKQAVLDDLSELRDEVYSIEALFRTRLEHLEQEIEAIKSININRNKV